MARKSEGDTSLGTYVLVTPARNEERFIGLTIESVVRQTIPPTKWVIVSDGSTDRTEEIAREHAWRHEFIELLARDAPTGRDFASKSHAFAAGLSRLRGVEYAYIGNLDADVSFQEDYFERMLTRFRDNPRLGVCGGLIHESKEGEWKRLVVATDWSVAGAVQLFRRECFEQVGGYMPLRRGGIDMLAETSARMHGWIVQTDEGLPVRHHRRAGTASRGPLHASFRRGMMEYTLGYHPVFQAARFLSRLPERPVGLASLARTSGYLWSWLMRQPIEAPADVVRYLRREQLSRLMGRATQEAGTPS
ncbi:MAG: glycosyltransferase family 2 protein [Candidatus Sumerlaeota bacterium]|nr:glycosyltransferase family 2 protein [Candidatus Sumerlaeota bacterium]